MDHRFSTTSPQDRYRKKKLRVRSASLRHLRKRGKVPRELRPQTFKALELIDLGERHWPTIARLSGLSTPCVYLMVKKIGIDYIPMRGSSKSSWCEKRLDFLLKRIEEVRRPIPDWLRPYSQELHKLYGMAEDTMAMMKNR